MILLIIIKKGVENLEKVDNKFNYNDISIYLFVF